MAAFNMLCALIFFTLSTESRLYKPFRPRLKRDGDYLRADHLGPSHRHHTINQYFGQTLHQNSYDHTFINSTQYEDSANPMIWVTDYGADPTGANDSTDAFKQAIQEALTRGSGKTLAYGAKDLGGVTINLAGGDYTISDQLLIPSYYGNMRVVDGTIRASQDFPPDSYLFVVGQWNNCNSYQNACGQDIGFQNLMLDCSNVCQGALLIEVMMGVLIGPQVFIYGFTTNGVRVDGGHETTIFNTWIGEYSYDSSNWENAKAIGVLFNNPDNYITDTIVFSGRIGVQLNGPSTTLKGVHTWNLQTQYNGSGIVVNAFQNRISDCYLDYNDLVLIPPIEHVVIEHSFFLYGTIYVEDSGDNRIDGLSIQSNLCDANGGTAVPNTTFVMSSGTFTQLNNVFIKNNMAYGIPQRTSNPTMTLHQTNSQSWDFDFSDLLAFSGPKIVSVDYTFIFDDTSNIVAHGAILNNDGVSVSVVTSAATSGTVICTVDQSTLKYDDGVSRR